MSNNLEIEFLEKLFDTFFSFNSLRFSFNFDFHFLMYGV